MRVFRSVESGTQTQTRSKAREFTPRSEKSARERRTGGVCGMLGLTFDVFLQVRQRVYTAGGHGARRLRDRRARDEF